MSTNGFREDELVSRRVKVGNEWQTKVFPVVGGRLRLAHESNPTLSIQTEIVRMDADFVVVRATAQTEKGSFCGTGTASAVRDARLADSLVELGETRAIARCLRFGGVGVEYTGFEEVSHVAAAADTERTESERLRPVAASPTTEDKPEAKPFDKPKNGNGTATQAQVRALYALTRRARYADEDVRSLLSPHNAGVFEELTRESASQLISYLQTEASA